MGSACLCIGDGQVPQQHVVMGKFRMAEDTVSAVLGHTEPIPNHGESV